MYGWENIISLHMTKTILFVSSFCKYQKTTTKKKIKNIFYFSVNNKNLTETPILHTHRPAQPVIKQETLYNISHPARQTGLRLKLLSYFVGVRL